MARRILLLLACTAFVACAASFDVSLPPVEGDPALSVVTVTRDGSPLWPGRHGILLTAVVENSGTGTAGGFVLAVDVSDSTGARADVLVEQLDPAPTLSPGESGEVRFEAAIASSAALSAFTVAISVVNSAAPAAELECAFASIREIEVTTAGDQVASDLFVSLREAITDAVATPGIERIGFSTDAFPAGTVTNVSLQYFGGGDTGLPVLDGSSDPIAIDGRGRVSIGMSGAHGGTKIFGLRLLGPVTVEGVAFDGWAASSPSAMQPENSCYGLPDDTGGAIQVLGGSDVVLSGLRISDVGQGYSRSCFHAAVRIDGGTGHRVRGSVFETFNGDAIRIRGGVRLVDGNLFRNAPTTVAERNEMDSAIVVESLLGEELWVTGNVIADMDAFGAGGVTSGATPAISGAALAVTGTDGGAVHVLHNVFARNGGGAVVRRDGRAMSFANNVYSGNDAWDIGTGAAATMRFEAFEPGDLQCNPTCPRASIDGASLLESVLLVVSSAGDTAAAWAPVPGSPLLDSGVDLVDRNGTASGRFDGSGPDRGAVEAGPP